jgi:hypothetical protein
VAQGSPMEALQGGQAVAVHAAPALCGTAHRGHAVAQGCRAHDSGSTQGRRLAGMLAK